MAGSGGRTSFSGVTGKSYSRRSERSAPEAEAKCEISVQLFYVFLQKRIRIYLDILASWILKERFVKGSHTWSLNTLFRFSSNFGICHFTVVY